MVTAAPPEVESFADLRANVQNLVAEAGGKLWDLLPRHDKENVPEFQAQLLPLLAGGQEAAVRLTDAFIAQRMDRPPFGIDAAAVVAGIRGEVDPADVYLRPFVTLWWGLGQGRPWEAASKAARARLLASLKADVLLATTHTMRAAAIADPEIVGYRRIVRGTCDLCLDAAGDVTGGVILQPIHPGCECVGDPQRRGASRTQTSSPRGSTEIREHGEMGPLLVEGTQKFSKPEKRGSLLGMDSNVVTKKNTKVGTRVKSSAGPTGKVTKIRQTNTGQKFAVKIRWDPIPGHALKANREGTVEAWIANPGFNLTVIS